MKADLFHTTGWHSLNSAYDLSSWEYYWECAPLDAPEWIAAGSTRLNPYYGMTPKQVKTMQRSYNREHFSYV